MPAISLDAKIANYVTQLNSKQKQAVLAVVKTFAEETREEVSWSSPAFLKELDSRLAELKSGSVKGRTWDQVKKSARASISPEDGL